MPRIGAERLRDRERGLVAAARAVFAMRGYESSSISEIADRAGVSDGLLYRYFSSKRDLLQHVLEDFYAGLIDDLERCVAAETNFAARLAALIRAHVWTFVSDMDLCRLFIAEIRTFDSYFGSDAHALNRRYTGVLMRVLADGKAEGQVDPDADDRLVRDLLYGGIEHIAWRHIMSDRAMDADAIADRLSRLLARGLAPEKK